MSGWYHPADERHIRRERARARDLRATPWWKAQLAKGECHYCHGHFPPDQLTMDHIIPVARGGTSDKSNVVPACFPCNQSKSAQTPAERILDDLGLGDDLTPRRPPGLPLKRLKRLTDEAGGEV